MVKKRDKVKNGLDSVDKSYIKRCLKRLKEMNAPLKDWNCKEIIDLRADDKNSPLGQCELCGHSDIRYEHIMVHNNYHTSITVGCICAGIMEGSTIAAKEREADFKRRSNRKKNYLKKEWHKTNNDCWSLKYKRQTIFIEKRYFVGKAHFAILIGKDVYQWKDNRWITDFLTARSLVFDIIDEVNYERKNNRTTAGKGC